jgi:hypothetical protein
MQVVLDPIFGLFCCCLGSFFILFPIILTINSFFIRPSYTITLQPEFIPYEQWKDLKADSKTGLLTWIKGALSKNDMQDSVLQILHFILSTSPMWDR